MSIAIFDFQKIGVIKNNKNINVLTSCMISRYIKAIKAKKIDEKNRILIKIKKFIINKKIFIKFNPSR